jgi:S-DNA-T family DNA segregation ATPase FtsK/SpoIIIE
MNVPPPDCGAAGQPQGCSPSTSVAKSISEKRQRQILGVLLAALAGLSLASVGTYEHPLPGAPPWTAPNACGPVGAVLAFVLVWALGRFAAFSVPLLTGAWAWNHIRHLPIKPLVVSTVMGGLLLFEFCALLGLAGLDRWTWSGGWGFAAALALHSSLGGVGSWIIGGALFGVTVLAASEICFHWIGGFFRNFIAAPAVFLWNTAREGWQEMWKPEPPEKKEKPAKATKAVKSARVNGTAPAASDDADAERLVPVVRATNSVRSEERDQMSLTLPGEERRAPKPRKIPPRPSALPAVNLPVPDEDLPPPTLLGMPVQPEDLLTASDLTDEARLLESKLNDFGVQGRVTEIHPGPVVTTFEFEPAAGVKVNQIVSREDDVALALRAQRIRILAPIPGKGVVGVEIPNRNRRTVYLREVLVSDAYTGSTADLKIPLGVDVVGQPFVADLTKMPHVLVAGATGSGKSVCLNSIITGLLFQHGPDTLRMVMVDPKMLELSAYNGIPHLVMPVVTEHKKASRALRWGVSEMEKRYKLMATCGARNIASYNEKVASGQAPTAPGSDVPPDRLSYVVIVVDELADLMLTAPAELEEPIARLAQMARAVGIHLVLATQRPSVDVITGVIKANFPSRIAFQVASKTDSRTVLDMNGAENLLGHGDMLFTPAGKPEPIRVHGAYVSEEETARVVDFWRAKVAPLAGTEHVAPLAISPDQVEAEEEAAEIDDDQDALIHDAAKLVIAHQQGSTSLLQRRLKVGYSRAGRLMDQLESIGVVGPFQGSKARDVLVDERWLEDRAL